MSKSHKDQCKEYYLKNKKHLKQKSKENRQIRATLIEEKKISVPIITFKTCTACNNTLPINKFSYRVKRGCHESKCKKCRCNSGKKYRVDNKIQISTTRKNKHSHRRIIDPLYAITCTLRSRLHKVLSRKTLKTSKLIGAPNGVLIKWMEFNLELDQSTGMTLENRGKFWHIDHVIPCNKFNLLEKKEQLICMNWTNLKPMIAHKNIAKQDNIIITQCLEHEIRLKLFGIINNINISNSTMKNWVHSRGALTTAALEKSSVQQKV